MTSPARNARLNAQAIWPGAVVVDRKRAAIYHRHPSEPKVMIDAIIGAMHTLDGQEIDTAWRTSIAPWNYEVTLADYITKVKTQFNIADVVEWSRGGEFIRFIAGQLEYNNDRNDVQLVSVPQAITGTVDDQRIQWIGAYGAGLDFAWINRTTRLVKLLTIQNFADLPIPSTQILTGDNPILRLQFQFSVSNNIDIYINGTRWNLSGQRDTTGNVEFRHTDTGEVLWYFDPGKAWDTNTDEHDIEMIIPITRFRRTGPNLFVEIRVPLIWLQNAIYPVYIDPTIDVSVSASDRDSGETSAGVCNPTLIGFNTDQNNEWAGFAFEGITITSYSAMVASYLVLYFNDGSFDEPDVRIYGEDAASPGVYTTNTNDISGRARTTNSVVWSNTDLGAPGSFNTASLNSIIDELATTYSYSSGVMALMMTSANGTSTRDCTPSHWDHSTDAEPALHIEYSQSAGETKTVTDNGAGLDFLSLAASLQARENGIGSDSLAQLASLSLPESSFSSDLLQLLASLSVGDFGSGAEFLSILESILKIIQDTGLGLDDIAGLSASLSLIESVTGLDLSAILASLSLQEAGRGIDNQTLAALLGLVDGGVGGDYLDLTASLSMSESGTGIDNSSQLASFSISESGASSDFLQLLASLSLGDSGSGSDNLSILQSILKLISDVASGIDNLSIQASLNIVDTGEGQEAIQLSAVLSIIDTGTGIDIEAVEKIAAILKQISDLASGLDSLFVSASLSLPEQALGADSLQLLASIQGLDLSTTSDQLQLQASLSVLDTSSAADAISILQAILKLVQDLATGTDAIGQISVSLSVSDFGLSNDQLGQLLAYLIIADFGSGIEVVVKYDVTSQIVKISFIIKKEAINFEIKVPRIEFSFIPGGN